jgi:serine/threonine protein kinase
MGLDRIRMVASTTLLSSDATGYAPGDLIGQKYRLVRFLGEGAQGSVWLAENLALSADVAIKIVRCDPSNPAPTLRLEQEARAAAQISHPAVVRVFDLGRTPHGDAFIVMEFLQGENLGDRLVTCGRLSPVEAVRTLLPIADVLHVAHERGIVHRDLKPENVHLARDGATVQPKLLDFGIAKLQSSVRRKAAITDVGMLVGSPAYLSPEQAFCRDDVDQAADIWSFCVVLYECITGALPFDSPSCRELFRQIEEEPPRPLLSHGVGDYELWEILRRGLAKHPEERWPDIQALGRALAGWLRARGIEDDISGMRLDSRWLARGRTELIAACEAAEEPSSRALPKNALDAGLSPTVQASRRRSPSRWLFAGGFTAALVPIALGYGLVSAGPRTNRAAASALALEAPPSVRPPSARDLPAHVAPPKAAPAPEPRAKATSTTARLATEPVRLAPVALKKRRPARASDLLDPY